MKHSLAKSIISKFQVMILSEMTVQQVKEEVLPSVKYGPAVNKEYRNNNFSIITDNEALPIELEISNN